MTASVRSASSQHQESSSGDEDADSATAGGSAAAWAPRASLLFVRGAILGACFVGARGLSASLECGR